MLLVEVRAIPFRSRVFSQPRRQHSPANLPRYCTLHAAQVSEQAGDLKDIFACCALRVVAAEAGLGSDLSSERFTQTVDVSLHYLDVPLDAVEPPVHLVEPPVQGFADPWSSRVHPVQPSSRLFISRLFVSMACSSSAAALSLSEVSCSGTSSSSAVSSSRLIVARNSGFSRRTRDQVV